MKMTINLTNFHDAFHNANRADNFSYEGRELLFDYLVEAETDLGEEFELDVIALCCEFAEADYEEIADNYSIDLSEGEDDEEKILIVADYLSENTAVCGQTDSGSFVYAQF